MGLSHNNKIIWTGLEEKIVFYFMRNIWLWIILMYCIHLGLGNSSRFVSMWYPRPRKIWTFISAKTTIISTYVLSSCLVWDKYELYIYDCLKFVGLFCKRVLMKENTLMILYWHCEHKPVCAELTKPDLCAIDSATLFNLFGFNQNVFQPCHHLTEKQHWN